MLAYRPPFLSVGPVTVYPDHLDPETYYYVVSVPELVIEREDDGDRAAFRATAILPPAELLDDGALGTQGVARVLLSFDVHLPLPDDPQGLLAQEIQRRWGCAPKRLSPAPLSGGTVTLAVARPGPDDAARELTVYTGQPPALVGDNRAALTIAAEGDEAQALVAAMSAGHLAGVLSYQLDLLGVAPSFEARMVVHWRNVYTRLRERDAMNAVFVSDEIERTLEQLAREQAVEIDVTQLSPDAHDAATRALFDELKEQLLSRLFEPPRPIGEVPIEERIGHGVRDVLGALLPGVSHTLRQLDQTLLVDTTIDLREQQVATYRHHPQTSLSGLLARAGAALAPIAYVPLDQLPHRLDAVTVELSAGAAALGVRRVDLRVQVLAQAPGLQREPVEALADEVVSLDPAAPTRQQVRYRRAGTAEPWVRYQADLQLAPELAPGGREHWRIEWRDAVGSRIWFDPQAVLDTVTLRLEIDDPAVFASARVDVEVRTQRDPAAPADAASAPPTLYAFSAEQPVQRHVVVVPDGVRPSFIVRETFRRVGEVDFVREGPPTTPAVHRIMNPFAQAWTMEVRAVAQWERSAALFVEFRVWDVLRGTWLRDERSFQAGAVATTLRFATSAETPRRAEARVTRVDLQGRPVRGPWTDLAGLVVAVTDEVIAERRVRVTLDAPRFADEGVAKVLVECSYQDADGAEPQTATLELRRDGAVADWRHRMPDPTRSDYRYRVRARSLDGLRYDGPWLTGGADDLRVGLPAQPWGG